MGPSMSIDGVNRGTMFLRSVMRCFNGAVDEHRRSPTPEAGAVTDPARASMGPSMSIDGVTRE